MKKTHTRKLLTFLCVLVFCTVMAVPAFAYTAVGVTTNPTFKQALIVKSTDPVPSLAFSYSVTGSGQGVAPSSSSMEVYPGVGSPTISDVSFSNSDTTTTTSETNITIDSGEKAVIKDVTVDFTGVTFDEPGVYRYEIQQTSSGQAGVSYDTQASTAGSKIRYLDVYVTDTSGTLAVDSCVIIDAAANITPGTDAGSSAYASGAKNAAMVNEFASQSITVSKTVNGNQASQDKYFLFTVTLGSAGSNSTLGFTASTAAPAANGATTYDASTMGTANGATSWNTDATGAVTGTFYLKHGDSATISGLPAGTSYSVVENPEGYKCDKANATVSGTIAAADVSETFTNTRSGSVPTGVVLSSIGGIAIAALGLGGVSYAVISSKKSKEEDYED